MLDLQNELAQIQQDLFDLGADLATPVVDPLQRKSPAKLLEKRVDELEKSMDRWQEILPPLKSFVLPGGSLMPAHLHLARTVCRRAERWVVQLQEKEALPGPCLKYLNRLSDYFFVLSRYVTKILDETELLWKY